MNDIVLCESPATSLSNFESWSPFCLKVHRALKVAGLPYTRRFGIPADFTQYNPKGQVPVLLVDGEPVPDSTAIVKKIDELAGTSFTADPEARLWEELADTSLSGFVVAARWADHRNWTRVRPMFFGNAPDAVVGPIHERVMQSLHARDVWRGGADRCWQALGELLDALDARAPEEHQYWVGRTLTVADLAIFAMVHSLRAPLTPPQAEEVGRRKRLVRYLDRIDKQTRGAPRSRPAMEQLSIG